MCVLSRDTHEPVRCKHEVNYEYIFGANYSIKITTYSDGLFMSLDMAILTGC